MLVLTRSLSLTLARNVFHYLFFFLYRAQSCLNPGCAGGTTWDPSVSLKISGIRKKNSNLTSLLRHRRQ